MKDSKKLMGEKKTRKLSTMGGINCQTDCLDLKMDKQVMKTLFSGEAGGGGGEGSRFHTAGLHPRFRYAFSGFSFFKILEECCEKDLLISIKWTLKMGVVSGIAMAIFAFWASIYVVLAEHISLLVLNQP